MTKATASKPKTDKKPSVTLEELKAGAPEPLPVRIGDQVIGYVRAKEFSTKSYGFGMSEKVFIPLANGKIAECQAGINITVLHSAPKK